MAFLQDGRYVVSVQVCHAWIALATEIVKQDVMDLADCPLRKLQAGIGVHSHGRVFGFVACIDLCTFYIFR